MITFDIEILEDGVISIKTDKISAAEHKQADEIMEMFRDAAGGNCTTIKRREHHVHEDAHDHEHQHGHE